MFRNSVENKKEKKTGLKRETTKVGSSETERAEDAVLRENKHLRLQ
jgi:hypothetical protein